MLILILKVIEVIKSEEENDKIEEIEKETEKGEEKIKFEEENDKIDEIEKETEKEENEEEEKERIEIEKCLVNGCETCISNNNYFCSKCINSDYEVNKYTGSCVKKTELVPSVTWKDIFRFILNDQKEINGMSISGPSFILSGITSSQINTRHAFLIYLTFIVKYDFRNLEENVIKIPALCEIEKGVEKTDNDINIIDYNCIGNSTIDDNYKLKD